MTIEDFLKKYEDFLALLVLEPELTKTKTVEVDLKGDLNPGSLLNALFFQENKWLGFQDFYKLYITRNEHALEELYLQRYKMQKWEDFLNGLRARLYRTQFGFLTEYHAYFMAKLVFGENNVTRDVDLDKLGIDFQIHYNNNLYNIHIFVDSERAWHFRNIKSQYKKVDDHVGIHVNMPYSRNGGMIHSLRYLSNGFGVYTKKYLEYLKQEISNGNIKKIIGVNENGFKYQN